LKLVTTLGKWLRLSAALEEGRDRMQDFLNPKSMLTPGVTGTFVMFLVNGLLGQFPELSPRFTALGISFLIGALVFYSHRLHEARVYEKGAYWVLNSLIVFVVGFGATHIAADVTDPVKIKPGAFLPSLVAPALAQDPVDKAAKGGNIEQPAKGGPRDDSVTLKKQLHEVQVENSKLKHQIEGLEKKSTASRPPEQGTAFFRRW